MEKKLVTALNQHPQNTEAKLLLPIQRERETAGEMAERIGEMLFPANSEPKIVSENPVLFQFVMSEFHAYEVS